MKERFIWVGVLVLIASWIGNYVYYQSQQIARPVFLDHYYEVPMEEEMTLDFYYLTDKSDRSRINYVELDGVRAFPVDRSSGFTMFANGQPIQYEQEFRHQYLRKVSVQFPTDELDWSSGEPFVFEHMTAHFSDSTVTETNIGKVMIEPKQQYTQVFETLLSGSSNQNRDEKLLTATKSLMIEKIIVPFGDEISDDIAVKVNLNQEELKGASTMFRSGSNSDAFSKDMKREWNEVSGVLSFDDNLYPIELNKDDRIRLSIWFNPDRQSYFKFGIQLQGKTDHGTYFIRPAMISNQPQLDENDIEEIIKKKGGRVE